MPITLKEFEAVRSREFHLWPSRSVFFDDLVVFLLGATAAFTFNVIGSLPACEIMVLGLLPYLLITHRGLHLPREYRWFYILLGLWLFGTIANDMYLGVSAPDKLKGMARIVFLGLDFTTLAILLEAARNKTRFMIVFALSFLFLMLWYFHLAVGNAAFDIQWKFGGSSSLTIAALLISSYFYKNKRYLICAAIFATLALLNLRMAFRSQMGIDFISGLLILPAITGASGAAKRSGAMGQAFRALIVILVVAGTADLANRAIVYGAQHGFFDPATQAKFESQASGKLGVLAGGRPETLVAIQAIRDSPIVGHGSYAVDPKYLAMESELEYKYGYADTDYSPDLDNPGIPTHSHLTLAWVESGLMGGVFWIYILLVTLYSLLVLLRTQPTLTPLYCYFLLNFVWDILYSPMGAANRILNSYVILICYQLIRADTAGRLVTSPLMRAKAPFVKRRVHLAPRPLRPGLR